MPQEGPRGKLIGTPRPFWSLLPGKIFPFMTLGDHQVQPTQQHQSHSDTQRYQPPVPFLPSEASARTAGQHDGDKCPSCQ